MSKNLTELDQQAIENFRDYIRIPTMSQITDYSDCINFLQKLASSINLESKIIKLKPNRPVVIITWLGTHPELPSICLNNHMDVVPVEEDKWTHPPFDAEMDNEGRIWGRGTQDMKLVGIQQLEAIRRMQLNGIRLARTIVFTFVPDEELGGQEGMKLLVQTPEFRALNIGFALDEGGSTENSKKLCLFFGEKHKWSVKFHVTGDVGHGSMFIQNTAAEKVTRLMQKMHEFRQEQFEKGGGKVWAPDVISLNVTKIEGGIQENVIPSEYILTVDIRLHPTVNLPKWQLILNDWCTDAGEGVWIEENVCEVIDIPTKTDASNQFYLPIKETINSMGFELVHMICPAVSDSRFLRHLGIPVFGLSLLTGESRIHMHNEYVNKDEFLLGITMYYKLLEKLGNLKENCTC